MLIKLAAVKSMYESRGGTSDLRLPTSEFRLLTFKASIFDMQLISLDIKNTMCITMFINAVCVVFLAKSDVRFQASQYLYYYVSVT